MYRNAQAISRDIQRLAARGFQVRHARDYSWVGVYDIDLPRLAGGCWTNADGKGIARYSMLIDLPLDFPRHPPGEGFAHPGHAVHVPDLHFGGHRIRDLHLCQHNPWLWLCFRELEWESGYGVLELVQIIEASLIDRAVEEVPAS